MGGYRYHEFRRWWIIFLIPFLVCGCLDESGQVAEGGIEGTGKSIGPISGFGSVYLNGIRLDTTDSRFIFEGLPSSQSQLFQGMVINAISDVLGSASAIEFHFNLLGALSVDKGDCEKGSLEAVKQQIQVDELTVLRNIDFDVVQCGDIVAVSGFQQTDGSIVATYMEKLDVTSTLFNTTIREGLVESLDEQALTFMLGEQLIEYGSAQLTGFPDGVITNGLSVRIVGREEAGRLIATSVNKQSEDATDGAIGSVDITGSVAAAGIDGFVLGNMQINLVPGTALENGTRSDIVPNARLLARTSRNDTGALVADEIIFIKRADVSVEAPVQAVNFVQGTVTLAGLTAAVNSFTLVLDRSASQQVNFSLGDVNIGDRLIIFGLEQGEGNILASRLERISIGSASDSASIEATVGSPINDPVFFAAGLRIDSTDLRSPTGFFEGDVFPITRADFFEFLKPGDRVRVSGLPQNDFLSATRVTTLNFSNSSVLNSSGSLIGGTNDIVAVWDGRLNTQADISNGTLQENMFIQSASNMPFFGFPPAYHDVHVFGPGNYSFDTCPGTLVNSGGPLGYIAEDGSTNCDPSGINDLSLIVGPGQLGVHLLMDWNASQNIDVAVVWDINGQFPADQLYVGPAGVAPSPDTIWSLVSVDGDADGIPGIAMVDGPFGAFSWNLNLNVSSVDRP